MPQFIVRIWYDEKPDRTILATVEADDEDMAEDYVHNHVEVTAKLIE